MTTTKATKVKTPDKKSAPVAPEKVPTPLEISLVSDLFSACLETDHKRVIALLAGGADPNLSYIEIKGAIATPVSPLQATLLSVSNDAATPRMLRKQVVRIAKTLFDAGARIDKLERNLLLNTVAMEIDELLDVLADHGARVKRHGFELMSLAMANESIAMIEALGRHGVSPNVRDDHHSTPFLDWCSGTLRARKTKKTPTSENAKNTASVIEKFACCGVNINFQDRMGATPLMRAIVCGENTIAEALILVNANTDILLRNGVGALHLAAMCGSQEFLRFLSAQGILLNDLKRLHVKGLQPDVKAIVFAMQNTV